MGVKLPLPILTRTVALHELMYLPTGPVSGTMGDVLLRPAVTCVSLCMCPRDVPGVKVHASAGGCYAYFDSVSASRLYLLHATVGGAGLRPGS